MDLSRPYATVCPTLDGEILITLAGTTRPLTGRELARLVRHGSQTGINKALQRLVDQGIVHRQEAGRAMLYSLNREHLAAPAVETLSELRSQLVVRLSGTFASWKLRPVHASLFGSAARGDGSQESDIDLFIVRPASAAKFEVAWKRQIEALAVKVRQWTGNQAGISEVGASDVARLRRTKPKVADELRKDAMTLYGKPIVELLGSAK